MSVIGNTALADITAVLISTNSTAYYAWMAIGTGTGQTASSTSLGAECTTAAIYSGLTRAACTMTRTKTTVSNDTISAVHTFTLSTASTGTIEIGECCVANSATRNSGSMVFLGDLSAAVTMVGGDSIKCTALTQFK